MDNYTTSTDIDSALELKTDRTDLDSYTNTVDIDTTLSNKADKTDLDNYMTTTDINATLSNKADKTDLYNYTTSTDNSIENLQVLSEQNLASVMSRAMSHDPYFVMTSIDGEDSTKLAINQQYYNLLCPC